MPEPWPTPAQVAGCRHGAAAQIRPVRQFDGGAVIVAPDQRCGRACKMHWLLGVTVTLDGREHHVKVVLGALAGLFRCRQDLAL